jgi:hypothetical protein
MFSIKTLAGSVSFGKSGKAPGVMEMYLYDPFCPQGAFCGLFNMICLPEFCK